ncbi:tetratricopeptide repeat protein [Amphibacillus sediminis]|uniref:tetratricopeptide repeat protein n=1 Tax=Amphibacillus sediminis TaxID=360185 RepID=UPI00082C0D84|nr:tetratricopeptide repeat protein [Amphibacillus sediminis]
MTRKQKEQNKWKDVQLDKKIIPFIPEGDFYFSKGVAAFYKRKFELALKWLQKAVEANPSEALYPSQMSIVYTEIGAYHAANQILIDVIKEHGSDYFDCYYLMANNYAHLGLLKDAKKYAALYLEKDPKGEFSSETEQLLTILELGLEEEDEWFEQEDELLAHQETAFYHLQRKQWSSALPLLKEMLTRFPDYHIAKHEYSYALFFSGEHSRALEHELDLYQTCHDKLPALCNLAVFHYEQNQTEQAKHYLEELVNIHPIHIEQALRVAITFVHLGCYNQGFQRLSRLPKARLKNHLSYFRALAKAAHGLGRTLVAEQVWQEGCRLHHELTNEQTPWRS